MLKPESKFDERTKSSEEIFQRPFTLDGFLCLRFFNCLLQVVLLLTGFARFVRFL